MEPASAAVGPLGSKRTAAAQYTVWEIVSRTSAAIVGGGVLTYWLGAAIAKTAVLTGLLVPAEAVYFTGIAQILLFTGVVIWVCAGASPARVWFGLAAMTALSVAVVVLTPALPTTTGRDGAPPPAFSVVIVRQAHPS